MKRGFLVLLAAAGLITGAVYANSNLTNGTYKTTGKAGSVKTSSTIIIKKISGRKFQVTRLFKYGEKSGRWSASGIDNGSRLVVEFAVTESDGMAGALTGLGGSSSSKTVRGVFKITNNKTISGDYYEVTRRRRGSSRRLIGTESGTRSSDSTDEPTDSGNTDGENGGTDGNDSGSTDGNDSGSTDGENGGTDGNDSGNTDGNNSGENGENGDGTMDGNLGEDNNGEPNVEDPAQDLKITYPTNDSVFLAGQVIDVKVAAEGATIKAEGSVEVIEGTKVRFKSAGDYSLSASVGEVSGNTVKGRAITAEVTKVVVLDTLSITDAKPPHFERKLGESEASRKEPAAILQTQSLRLEATITGAEDLTETADVQIVARVGFGDLVLAGTASVKKLKSGASAIVRALTPLNKKVAINALQLNWSVAGKDAVTQSESGFTFGDDALVALEGGSTSLRVYTVYKTPVNNVQYGGGGAINTKHHYEKACKWADGASANVGQGADSIAWNIDNKMRHYVHPKDFNGFKPEVGYYAEGSEPPTNYDDLPGKWGIREDTRRISSLYYPPLEPTDDYQEYKHYRRNFGWWLLDNPTHTGGRCNQQAALVCDIVGLLGIKASVHYLQRVGRGKKTRRPVRMYFYAAGGSGPWNFHGIVRVELEEGEWLYDGSFSSPPRRLNGERTWAEKPGGPFIQKWAYWLYDDVPYSEKVPADDQPDTWDGIQ